jgi:fructose-1,6-bisphosphatase III
MSRVEREGKLGHVVFEDAEIDYLRALKRQCPTIDAAVARQAELRANMTLPKGMSHAFSDIHGEIKKLRHVINNASGQIRPLVESLFGQKLSSEERLTLLNIIYYPQEALAYLAPRLRERAARAAFARATLLQQLDVLRHLGKRYPLSRIQEMLPEAYRGVLTELLFAEALEREPAYVDAIVEALVVQGKELELVRLLSRAVRNISVDELIVAGDLGDRGPRIDKVTEYLMRQPKVAITWGNHDISWMGACLGHEALIAVVLRISLRYGCIAQLEEGYGIPLDPLRELADEVYKDDPAARFKPKNANLTDPLRIARMQKAIAIIQFKLEGQVIRRNPHYQMEDRNLLHKLNLSAGTVDLGEKSYELLDKSFPTVNPKDPYALTPAERSCLERLKKSFLESPVLWRHMSYLFQRGDMFITRDNHLIFHGCVPVDAEGRSLSFSIDGTAYSGRALFDVLESAVQRAWRRGDETAKDLLWYLWTGPVSPLFGKDKMATFESYFVADKATHKENKNPYYKLIHEAAFCRRIFQEFDVDPERGLLVNGHVPVKLEAGESPVKKSGAAVNIDGAFSEAYGDKGYTLVLDADRTYIASHHHFESIEEAITKGADIIPERLDVKVYEGTRRVGDTERGEAMRREIASLNRLILAYEENVLGEGDFEREPDRPRR